MIDDLDRTVEALLRRDLPPELVTQITISFAPPDDQFPPTSVPLPAIDLFMYDLRENRELRSNERRIERRADGTAIMQRPAARLDCSYLVTAWPSESSNSPALDEHRLLGEVVRVLLGHPTIPPEVVQGRLQGQELLLPATVLQPGYLQSIAEFWQALGGKPKATFNFTVTIGLDIASSLAPIPLVAEKVVRLKQATEQQG